MRVSGWRASVLLLLVVLMAGVVAADCVTSMTAVSLPASFPNLHPVAMAWNGSRIGVVKVSYTPDGALWFALYDEFLTSRSSDVEISPRSSSVIGLVWNGSEFALLYRDEKLREVLQRIDADGSPSGAPILLNAGHTEQQEYSEFLWIPAEPGSVSPAQGVYAFARTMYGPATTGVWLSLLTPDGTTVFERNVSPAIFENKATPHIVAATSTRIGIVWTGVRTDELPELQFASVDTTSSSGVIRTRAFGGRDPRVASDGQEFLVLSVGPTSAGRSEILETRFSVDGEMTVGTRHFMDAPRIDLAPLQLAWKGSEYAFGYNDYFLGLDQRTHTYRLRTFHADGTSIADTAFSPVPAYSTFDATAPFIAVGTGYVGAVGRSGNSLDGWHSFLASRCPLGAQLFAPRSAGIGELLSMRVETSGGTPPYSYFWNLGDETVALGASVTHRYRVEGEFTLHVTVTDADQNVATIQRVISIGEAVPPPPPAPLAVEITSSAASVAPRHTVSFSAQVTGGTAPYTYEWSFGDGGTATAGAVNHAWMLAGTYVVQLTVSDSMGVTQTKSVIMPVLATRRNAVRR